jgi:hypothetical protein
MMVPRRGSEGWPDGMIPRCFDVEEYASEVRRRFEGSERRGAH